MAFFFHTFKNVISLSLTWMRLHVKREKTVNICDAEGSLNKTNGTLSRTEIRQHRAVYEGTNGLEPHAKKHRIECNGAMKCSRCGTNLFLPPETDGGVGREVANSKFLNLTTWKWPMDARERRSWKYYPQHRYTNMVPTKLCRKFCKQVRQMDLQGPRLRARQGS